MVSSERDRRDDGMLSPCPDSPNCVSSETGKVIQHVEPIAFDGSVAEALARLRQVIAMFARARIVHEDDRGLRVEFTSRVFRFVDDVDLRIDAAARVIHVRSASRVGRYDFGVNRRRVEALRSRFRALTPTPRGRGA
jgi:uncharacterized protein (DUF1499 family)